MILVYVFCCCTQDAMAVLGMPEEERMSMLRVVAGVLHFGNIEVKQRPREEWATIPTATGQLSHSVDRNAIICCTHVKNVHS